MNELWKERLQKIENLEERRLLRGILTDAFGHLENYSNEQFEKIEKRVFDEIEDIESNFDIYCSMVSLEEYDPISDFQFPLCPEDVSTEKIDITALIEGMESGNKPIMDKIYLEMDYLELKDLQKSLKKRTFHGKLVTNKKEYPIEITLHPHKGYEERLEYLYNVFLQNNIPWRTVFHPYLHKFMDLRLETNIIFEDRENIEEVTFDLEEIEPYKKVNQVPLWNIRKLMYENAGFPSPAGDRINYEHTLHLATGVDEHGYLVDSSSKNIHFIRRERNGISIISPIQRVSQWNLLQVVKRNPKIPVGTSFFGNDRKEMFTDRFARRESRIVRSEAEIKRIINTFTASEEVELVGITLHEDGDGNRETYRNNPFLKDYVRTEEVKKTLQLSFSAKEENIFVRDRISFLVSEVQCYFPEYECMGELV